MPCQRCDTVLLVLLLAGCPAVAAESATTPSATTNNEVKHMHATGPFDVKMTAQSGSDAFNAAKLGRQTLTKTFSGDLQGSGVGEMLMAMGDVKGSAGYVAIERVDGILNGRTGSFVLQHSGTMNRGAPHLLISVVPDSGSGELTGLAGTMTIQNDAGDHRYIFDYTLP